MLARTAAAAASTLARRSSSRFAPAMATVTVPGNNMLVSHLSTKAATLKKASAATAPGGAKLASMTAENPHVDVVKYAHKSRTWTLNHVDYFSKALAIGLTENGLQPGDVVLSWLPEHFSEQASKKIL
jgi:non-ribosomal peptide synthetase component E (peptide arylation enzyme)